jgi:toxin HigB-1
MKIDYSPKFAKQFKKLPKDIKELSLKSEKLFRADPFNSKLGTHKLHGRLKDYWAFSLSYDYRVIFSFVDDDFVKFHAVGKHDIYR